MARKDTPDSARTQSIERYDGGWRAGKPIEDPEKTKRWGFVSAHPSEYLISIRDGKLNPRRSGQGATLFKWPWETIAIVPTTLQKLEFTADQITLERVGVQVKGLAVYRIAEPLLAYRVLNFSYGERASEKLALTLREMFEGAARRLIANLRLDDCLARRKEAIASFLMEEIAPVVGGRGAPADATDQGWGVVIDTIEIQDVRILSDKVFADLQAPFRAELATRAEAAELERQRGIAERRADNDRRIAEADILSARDTRTLKARAEAEAAELESQESLRAEQARAHFITEELERKEALARKKLEIDQQLAMREAESQAQVARRKAELEREKDLAQIKMQDERRQAAAQAELSAVAARERVAIREAERDALLEKKRLEQENSRALEALQVEESMQRGRAELEKAALAAESQLAELRHAAELKRLEQEQASRALALNTREELDAREQGLEQQLRLLRLETERQTLALELEKQRGQAEITRLLNDAQSRLDLVNHALPQLAQAFKQNFGTVQYTHVGGGPEANPLALVTAGFSQLLGVARAFGFDPLPQEAATTPKE